MKKAVFLAILLSVFIILACNDDDIITRDEEIQVALYPDTTVTVFYNDTIQFTYNVFSTPNTAVTWYVNEIESGNDSLGIIDTSGKYTNSGNHREYDEVWIKVVSDADTGKSDSAHVIIKDRFFVYVDSALGDNANGKGTLANPYRTITRGLSDAIQGQIVRVAEGTYSDGEVFPLTPIFEVTVQGYGTSLTFVRPPQNDAAFSLQYERTTIKDLTIRGENKQGIGVEFEGGEGIDSLSLKNMKIVNCHTGAIKTGSSNVILFEDNVIDSCIYGVVIQNAGQDLVLTGSSFTNIDSIAIHLIDPIINNVDFTSVTVDGALIGLHLAESSFALILNSVFANIDSVAVLLNASAQMENNFNVGNNDFSGCSNWCVINATALEIGARGNTWPASDSTTIDTQYIYDDDENASYGEVLFIPWQ